MKPSGRKTILLVDDEAGTVDALSAVLEDAGFIVLSAYNGRSALESIRSSVPDLVVLDFVMPVMDGAQMLKALRQDERLKSIPVLMMSGIPESMVRRKTRGFDGYLRKPFGLDELLSKVSTVSRTRSRSE